MIQFQSLFLKTITRKERKENVEEKKKWENDHRLWEFPQIQKIPG